MATKKKQSTWAIVLTIVLSLAAWYIKGQEDKKRENAGYGDEAKSEKSANSRGAHSSSVSDRLAPPDQDSGSKPAISGGLVKFVDRDLPDNLLRELTLVKFKNREFDVLRNCTLIDHRNNDGDSFHVKHSGEKTEFRLYYVDTPESRKHKHNGKRIQEQGEYFGGLSMQVTTEVGKIAKSFVKDLLKKPFTVVTKWEDVYTPERKYCYVIVKWQGRDVYLHELLVLKGLVRIKTRGAALPDNTNYHNQKANILRMEAKVKAAKLGVWGM